MRLRQLLNERFGLIVSLPRNEAALAKAAANAGADALKVHLNVHHHASGTTFGSWKKEKKAIEEIVRAVDIPVGIVPGAEELPSDDELSDIAKSGLDFWDTFLHHATSRLLSRRDLPCMMAVNCQFPLERAAMVADLGAQVIEASIVPSEEYGSALTARDLISYRILTKSAAPTPVVIPSQRRYQPLDVPYLAAAGARGLVIGAIVTGHDSASVGQATAEFRRAIDLMELERGDIDISLPLAH